MCVCRRWRKFLRVDSESARPMAAATDTTAKAAARTVIVTVTDTVAAIDTLTDTAAVTDTVLQTFYLSLQRPRDSLSPSFSLSLCRCRWQ